MEAPPPSPTNPCLGTSHQDTSPPDLHYNIGMPVADIIRYLICCLGKQPYQVVNSGVVEQIELSAQCVVSTGCFPQVCVPNSK